MASSSDHTTDARDADRTSNVGAVAAEHIAEGLRPLAWPVDALTLAPDNCRAHADADVDAIAESLRLHQQQKPIVAKRSYRGATNAVLAGNGTLLAARRLGWRFVATTWFDGTDEDARLFALRDNRVAELSRWDTTALVALQADGVDLLSLWHDDVGLADLVQGDAPVPRFTPVAAAEHRLDELANNTECPACGHRWHQERR